MSKKRTIIHVAQQAIARNRKYGTDDPPIIVRTGARSARHRKVELRLDGKLVGTFVYSPHDPLACGARLWLEVEDGVDVTGS